MADVLFVCFVYCVSLPKLFGASKAFYAKWNSMTRWYKINIQMGEHYISKVAICFLSN